MKKLIAAFALAGLALSTTTYGQTADSKTEWATKVVALQQGPEQDRLVNQLAGVATQELINKWGPHIQSSVPKAKQQKASEDLNAELRKYSEEARQILGKQVTKVGNEALVPAYVEKFTLEELQQIAAFFESPAIRKYQSIAPELGNLLVQKLVEASRPEVLARSKQFDDAALKIVGSAPAAPGAQKPPAKK